MTKAIQTVKYPLQFNKLSRCGYIKMETNANHKRPTNLLSIFRYGISYGIGTAMFVYQYTL